MLPWMRCDRCVGIVDFSSGATGQGRGGRERCGRGLGRGKGHALKSGRGVQNKRALIGRVAGRG